MMNCMVVGDSIAQGVAAYLPDCQRITRNGISSTRAIMELVPRYISADSVVFSLGANDGDGLTTINLMEARSRVRRGSRVVWLLPNTDRAGVRAAIEAVAARYGDQVVDTRPHAGGRLHPSGKGYRAIAARVLAPLP